MIEEKDQQIIRRMEELAEQSYQNNTYYFTDFLAPGEAALAYRLGRDDELTLWGGLETSERVMIRFGNEEEMGYRLDFPIKLVKIEPVMKKFADNLTHRDFLGALMNLGIERSVLGDILVEDKVGYVFVAERMAEYIMENLDKVRHTNVVCTLCEEIPTECRCKLSEETVTVSAPRMDAIIAKVYHLSRSQTAELFRRGEVFSNGRLCTNHSKEPKEGEIISVRGQGKFIYQGVAYNTKKDKQALTIMRYV